MNDAIKLAIEKGGYKKGPYWWPVPKTWGILLTGDDGDKEELRMVDIVLDPLFWQALGKALGWECMANHELDGSHSDYSECKGTNIWRFRAHEYFDTKLTGGSEEAFWKELLSKQV